MDDVLVVDNVGDLPPAPVGYKLQNPDEMRMVRPGQDIFSRPSFNQGPNRESLTTCPKIFVVTATMVRYLRGYHNVQWTDLLFVHFPCRRVILLLLDSGSDIVSLYHGI